MNPQPEDEVIRKRQRERARLTAILLGRVFRRRLGNGDGRAQA